MAALLDPGPGRADHLHVRTDPHRRGEVGQSMIVVMLFLPVLLAVAAILIDVTGLFGHKRSLQNRADAAALAAAQNLNPATGICDLTCVGVLNDYYHKNGGSADVSLGLCVDTPLGKATNCYAAPYSPSPGVVKIGQIEVRLRDS